MKFSNPDVRPAVPAPKFENVPEELKAKPQWVLWRFVWSKESKQWAKVPYDATTQRKARSNDRATWSSFETARLVYVEGRGDFDGVGFVFSVDDEYCGVDFDECLDASGHVNNARVTEWIDTLDSYTEKSVSGTGIHIIVKAVYGGGNKVGNIEVYDRGRYFIFTGHANGRCEIHARQGEIDQLKGELKPDQPKQATPKIARSKGSPTVKRVLDKAFRGKNGSKIAALDLGGTAGYKSNSEADQAYCNLISFYTGPDASLIDQVFRQSKRYRNKWDEKHGSNGHTYGDITIERTLKDHKGGFYKWPSSNGTPNSENGKPKPSEYFERRFPNLAEKYGRAVDEGQRDGVLYVRDLNEDFFAATLGEEGSPEEPIVYISDEGAFWGYSKREGVFIEQDENVLRTRLSKLLLDCARECQSTETDTTSLMFQHRNAAKARGIFDKARGYLHQTSDYFSTNLTDYLPCANGMLNLKTRQLEPFNPNFRRRNKLGVPYDPSAKCDRLFLDTLVRQSLELDDQDLLQRYSGTVLIGRNISQVVGMAIGTAGGGKGAFVGVLCGIIGKGNVGMLRTSCLGERFEIGRYNGRTLLLGPDVKQDFLSGASATYVKALVGGDNLTLEFKGSNSKKNIEGEFNVFVTCNSRLKVRIEGDSDAWRRRLRIFDYHKPKPKKPIPDLDSLILATEGPGVLNWMLEGFYRERESGFGLVLNQRQQDRVDNLLLESESHAHFAREMLIKQQGATLTVDKAHKSYVAFCNQRGWSALGRSKFGSLIGDSVACEFGLTTANDIPDEDSGKAQRGWRGLTLRHDDEPFDIVIDDSSDTERSTPCETPSDSKTSIRSVRTDENDDVAAQESDTSDTISPVHFTETGND